jgi:hypothetical protein
VCAAKAALKSNPAADEIPVPRALQKSLKILLKTLPIINPIERTINI